MSIEVAGFEIDDEIGRGGFGVVYRARQLDLGRLAAVKVLLPGAGPDELQRRFAQECRAVGALRPHPNVVTVYSTGMTTDGAPYLAMQYLAGGSLAERTPLAPGAVAALGARLADGLGVAHAGGVIHRDVKPANILFDDDAEPVLVDFGISAMIGDGSSTSSEIALSVAYAPPEVLRGDSGGIPADVYALGATLFAAVRGRAPFTDPDRVTPIATLTHRILRDPVEDLRPQGVPDALCAVIERCMAKNEADRFASMADLRAALLPIEGDAVLASPAELWGMPTTTVARDLLPFDDRSTAGRTRSRRRTAAIAAAAVVLLGGGLATAAVLGSDDSGSPVAGRSDAGSSAVGPPQTSGVAGSSSVVSGRPTSSETDGPGNGSPRIGLGGATRSRSGTPTTRGPRSSGSGDRNHPPVLGALPVVRADERSAVDTSFPAADADGDPVRFRTSGLPAGLRVSSTGRVTGRISGAAADVTRSFRSVAAERFVVTVTVTDSHGASVSGRTTWSIRDTTRAMPNYHLRRGCDGQGSCQEPVPNIRDLGPRTLVCRRNVRRAGLILSQSVRAGTSFSYGTKVRYTVARKSC